MSSICRVTVVTAFLLAIFHSNSFAQLTSSKYEIGLQLGTLVYQGDLAKSAAGDFKLLKPSLGVYVGKTLDKYFALRANFLLGKLAADDSKYSAPAWKQMRNFNFNTTVAELSSTLVFNPLGENSNDNFHRLSPYVYAGAGVSFIKVRRDWSNLNRAAFDAKSEVITGLPLDSAHSLPKVIAVLPIGAGLRFAVNDQLSLNAEATYRFTTTDYLDGFKYAANPDRRDNYYGLSLGISYRFGGYKCPKVGQ